MLEEARDEKIGVADGDVVTVTRAAPPVEKSVDARNQTRQEGTENAKIKSP